MYKISVIVPVYNVEAYIAKCLDSLVNQTLKDIEIIVVNDGSLDNSQSIIDKYVKKYKNVFSYIKKNGGLSDARNYGIKRAHGEYIAFVDSDDYVDLSMYDKMYEKAKENDFDLVVCDLKYVYENSQNEDYVESLVLMDTDNIKRTMLDIYPAAWNKIFKKELFNNKVFFKKGVWFEDVEFLYRLFSYIKKIGVVKEGLYYYLQRVGSITSTIDERLYNYIDNWNGIIDFYKKKNLYQKYSKELEYCYVRYIYATFVKRAVAYCKEDYDVAVDKAIFNVKKNFPKYKLNKYFYRSTKGIYLVLFNKFVAGIIYKKFNKEKCNG